MAYGIGKRIKEKREELGLTQLQLAERMGYTSKSAVCKVERGDDNITTDRVRKFAKALNCSESFLMGWSETSAKEKLIEAMIESQETKELLPNNNEEKELMRAFRELNEEQKRQIVMMLAFFKNQNEGNE